MNWDQNTPEFSLNIGELNLPPGTYLIQIKTDTNDITEKLIIH